VKRAEYLAQMPRGTGEGWHHAHIGPWWIGLYLDVYPSALKVPVLHRTPDGAIGGAWLWFGVAVNAGVRSYEDEVTS
jgi:hypothetical protein